MFSLFKKKTKKPKKIYVVIDGEKKEYIYIDGKYIPRDKIISIDTSNRKIVYIDYDNTIKISNLPEDIDVKEKKDQSQRPRIEMFM
ncbi:MAG: hypothetical protein QXW20_07505 [Ignisphaera sp.]